MPKKKRKTLTIRQQKLIRIISENLGNKKGCKTMYKMMLEAGYSESNARQQSLILAGIKDEVKPIVNQLEIARQEAIDRLKKLLPQAKYRDLIDGIDKLTKNAQLLSGGKTERGELQISWKK